MWHTSIVYYVRAIFSFPISSVKWSIKNISNPLFRLIRSFAKIIEFDHAKFPRMYNLKMLFKKNFLRLTVTACFQKTEFRHSFLQSASYYTWLSRNKLTFHPYFIVISDNIAGVVGVVQLN